MSKRYVAAVISALLWGAALAAPNDLTTVAERSGFKKTGRYEEVEQLCNAYAEKWPEAVRCTEFGRTPEGRPMLALIVTRTQVFTAEEARTRGLPVLLIQGGIHAGEIDGKDAGFLALKEMLQGRVAAGALEKQVLVFVPVFNIDGHERFGRWNRPNQVGPEEMGWRVTAQNFNLNRDYTKADAPEMQAMQRLLNAWDPILYVDLHVTDGAQFQHDIANLLEPTITGADALRPLGKELLAETNKRIAAKGALPLDFYPSFRVEDDPASGFALGNYLPRFSTGYWALSNRFALLVETHSWKDYPTRVKLTHDTFIAVTELTARDGERWLQAAREADAQARAIGGTKQTLAFDVSDKHHLIDFKGYAYTREPSAISGALMTKYDPKKPQVWKVPFYDDVKPAVEEMAPTGGYVVPAAYAATMSERLKNHGIEFRTIQTDTGVREVEAFRAQKAEFGSQPFEGHMSLKLTGQWAKEKRSVDTGSLFVPIAQPKARLVMILLEPRSPDSYASWGFFNAHFEPKEYMEPYVAEEVAKEMLAKRPEVAAKFKKRLAEDPEFAKNPQQRLDFFYRLHSSWDERLNLYPIVRTSAVLN